MYYFSAEQNLPEAQFNLGVMHYKGEYINRDVNKAIGYFKKAANQNFSNAFLILGYIYLEGIYTKVNIKKAIKYLLSAEKLGNALAQIVLGLFYTRGCCVTQDVNKGINFCLKSLQNKNTFSCYAYFMIGYYYHESKYIERNIRKAIIHYKEASSFNEHYSKNNIGIIYKNGFGNEIPQNIGLAMSYFEESIRMCNDEISMYNLSHIYIYEIKTFESIDKSINLLIRALPTKFKEVNQLLCIALILKNEFDVNKIFQELNEKIVNSKYLINSIYSTIILKKLYDKSTFENIINIIKT